ncbi:MAG: HPP family protein [Desulfovibrio sp.]|jgi:CBS-domain-containing membrane protein|nr:HPP family protein [Desulfovibrio sp.]
MLKLSYWEKIKGEKIASGLPAPQLSDALASGVGGLLIIGVLYLLHGEFKLLPSFIIPFGASAVLVFAAPWAPFSQPRNVIVGHLVAAMVGVAIYSVFPLTSWLALALANGLAIFLMVLFKAVHPPAGATPLLPVLTGISDFTWLMAPVLTGSIIIVVIGVLYNNLIKKRRYPVFWY